MSVSYNKLKESVYLMMSTLGLLMLFASQLCAVAGANVLNALSYNLSSFILFFSGLICVFFSLVTYIIRDDPDVWR